MAKAKESGRAIGARARAEALSAETRKDIARRAAAARWGGKALVATHKGNFQQEFGLDVECYVLNDDRKTAVISQTGMGVALGLSSRGNAFPRFLSSRAMVSHLGADVREKIAKPLEFQWSLRGARPLVLDVKGYDVTLLIDVCKAALAADSAGELAGNQKAIAAQARVIVNASAKSGIQNLVYALTGYDPTKEEVVAAFKLFVREEAREYEKEFPDQLYKEWYRLYQLPEPEKNKPWKFKHLTLNQVYWPLARSSGRILELTQAQRSKNSARHKKLHQFLSDVGVKALRTHLGQLLGIAQVSRSRSEYERHVDDVFGDQMNLDLRPATTSAEMESA